MTKPTSMTVAVLRKELEKRNLDTSGLKAALVERLTTAMESETAGGDETAAEVRIGWGVIHVSAGAKRGTGSVERQRRDCALLSRHARKRGPWIRDVNQPRRGRIFPPILWDRRRRSLNVVGI